MSSNMTARASTEADVLLTSGEAGALARVKPKTLANWRALRVGPPYVKLGPGRCAPVRYPKHELLAWLRNQRVSAA